MNKERIVAELQSKYPGKTIVQPPPEAENPTEIICEIVRLNQLMTILNTVLRLQ